MYLVKISNRTTRPASEALSGCVYTLSCTAPDTFCAIVVQYKAKDYMVAAMVSGGCALFLLTGSVTSSAAKKEDKTTSILGVVMMVCACLFPAFCMTAS